MADPRKPLPELDVQRLAAMLEELRPPGYVTLTVGQGVDDHTAAEAGENPEARF